MTDLRSATSANVPTRCDRINTGHRIRRQRCPAGLGPCQPGDRPVLVTRVGRRDSDIASRASKTPLQRAHTYQDKHKQPAEVGLINDQTSYCRAG